MQNYSVKKNAEKNICIFFPNWKMSFGHFFAQNVQKHSFEKVLFLLNFSIVIFLSDIKLFFKFFIITLEEYFTLLQINNLFFGKRI